MTTQEAMKTKEGNLIEPGPKEGRREYRDYSEKARHRVGCELWWKEMSGLVAGWGESYPGGTVRAETGGLGKQISLVHLKCRKHRGTLRDERGSGKYLVYYKKRSAFVSQVISNPRGVASGEEGELCGYIYSGGCVGAGQKGW